MFCVCVTDINCKRCAIITSNAINNVSTQYCWVNEIEGVNDIMDESTEYCTLFFAEMSLEEDFIMILNNWVRYKI
jgi:hypothetical protein